jgi:hypothetical protein
MRDTRNENRSQMATLTRASFIPPSKGRIQLRAYRSSATAKSSPLAAPTARCDAIGKTSTSGTQKRQSRFEGLLTEAPRTIARRRWTAPNRRPLTQLGPELDRNPALQRH